MDDNTQSWLDFAMRPYDQGGLGLARHQAAGLVGNLQAESGRGLPSWGPTGDDRTAWGTAQWRKERLDALKAMYPNNYQTAEAQQAFMRHELDTSHSKAYDALKAAQTPEDAAHAFNKLYEISADTTGGRAANARALMGDNPVAAINAAAGIKPALAGGPAMAFTGGDGEPGGALSANNALGPGALQQIMKGEEPNKLNSIGAGLSQIGASLAGISSPSQAASLNAQAAQLRKDGKADYKTLMGPDGTLYRIDDSGNVTAVKTDSSKQKPSYEVVMGKDDNGNPIPIGRFEKTSGGYTPYGSTAPAGPPAGGDPNLTGQDRYNTLTPDEQRQIDAWYKGTGIQPSQYSLRNNPRTQKLIDAAQAVYPDMDFTKYSERQNFAKGMASKSPTSAGGQFISAPTVLDHITNLADDYLKLGNSGGGPLGYGTSAVNTVKDLTGGNARKADQTSADNNADTAGKEITSFLTRGHGGVSERQEAHEKLYLPTAAPEVQAAALEAYRKQVADRFYELYEGAKGSMGANNPELAKAAEAFETKDKALQAKIAKLKKGDFSKDGEAPAAAAPASDGKRPPLASFFQ
jgi:hypothetical protein